MYFGDVAGFTEAIAASTSVFGVVDILNGLYAVCDHVITEFDVFKVETVSDAYLVNLKIYSLSVNQPIDQTIAWSIE